jgi:hypothetical protein
VDRPNVFQTPHPESSHGVPSHDPESPGVPSYDEEPMGATPMPGAPDPADASATPMGGDVPQMSTPGTARRFDAWNYPTDSGVVGDGADLVGYRIEAIDGHIGKVDESSTLVGEQYLVVDTGPWIFGKKVLLPAGTVNHVDPLDQKVYVDRTKTQIKDAPEFNPDTYNSDEYRGKIGDYYRDTYGDQM